MMVMDVLHRQRGGHCRTIVHVVKVVVVIV